MADTRGRHRATRGFRNESRKSPDYCQLFGALKITGLVHIEQVLSHKCRPITHKDLQLMTHSEWLTINVQHHLPHGRTHRLVKAKPDFPPPAKWVVVSFRWGEEWAAHWSVPNWRGGGGGDEEVTTINYPNSDDLRVSSCPESSPQYDSTTNMLLLIYGTVKGHYKLTLVSCFL